MNDSIPVPYPPEFPPSAPNYKDRSGGLVFFGILTMLLGCLCGLFVPLMLFGQEVNAAKNPAVGMPLSTLLPAMAMYGGLAVVLIWLGIGSITARRWARALLLIFSWSWLVMGVCMTGVMAIALPNALVAPQPSVHGMTPAVMAGIMVVTFIFLFIFFIAVPLVWILFYQSRNVKATCEARHPAPGWTDRCPLPVLAVCIWLGFSVPTLLVMCFMAHPVMALFGTFLTGAPAAIVYVVMAAIWGYGAWSLYRLEPLGWWIVTIAMCVMSASSLITFSRHNMMEMYQQMQMPAAQLNLLQHSPLLEGNRMLILMCVSIVVFLGYLLFIRRYIRSQPQLPPAAEG